METSRRKNGRTGGGYLRWPQRLQQKASREAIPGETAGACLLLRDGVVPLFFYVARSTNQNPRLQDKCLAFGGGKGRDEDEKTQTQEQKQTWRRRGVSGGLCIRTEVNKRSSPEED